MADKIWNVMLWVLGIIFVLGFGTIMDEGGAH